RIVSELQRLHKAGQDLSYNALAKRNQSLVSAAAYHFGSYRRAVEKANIPYGEVLRRPRWTKQSIIAQIKKARRQNLPLHWSAVTQRRDELGKAAFASLQPRLFGQWHRALHAAGMDADDVSQYRAWDRNTVLFELRSRSADGEAINSGALQKDDAGLHAAAVRHFGSYEVALKAAKLNPDSVRLRKKWTKTNVLKAIKSASARGTRMSDSAMRQQYPALYGASVRLFGNYTAARKAAGVKYERAKRT
ncbi:MAG: hypothetical protein JO353_04255, partial [Phycisphaerae bacterium]|nr:hypothetical protein [Phycisphaerae bacterium]